ncbi:MAG TPA: methyltransferase domain-containing protein [Anaeromyxobacteraceae bacterium]|nr:methyltransferase domain-containing protein [Anaeromyxobacteraceae bacterium]
MGPHRHTEVGERLQRGAALGIAAFAAVALTAAPQAAAHSASGAAHARKQPDVPYEPTPPDVVRKMLDLASVGPSDVVYDLGCGDGRIVIEAAKRGARGVGVDIDPQRIRVARANAVAAGVQDRVEFREGDLFETDVRPATVVTLFLWPHINLRLRPTLQSQLRPGARVVSYYHDMGDWKPREVIPAGAAKVYLWVIEGGS